MGCGRSRYPLSRSQASQGSTSVFERSGSAIPTTVKCSERSTERGRVLWLKPVTDEEMDRRETILAQLRGVRLGPDVWDAATTDDRSLRRRAREHFEGVDIFYDFDELSRIDSTARQRHIRDRVVLGVRSDRRVPAVRRSGFAIPAVR